MKRWLIRVLALVMLSLAASPAVRADDDPPPGDEPVDDDCSLSPQLVTYYSEPAKLPSACGRRGTIVGGGGFSTCKTELVGTYYKPASSTVLQPAIVYNHGSEHSFEWHKKACSFAEYFVARGYHVFVPFRPGQGDIKDECLYEAQNECDDDPSRARKPATTCPLNYESGRLAESTGKYILQAREEYKNNDTALSGCKPADCGSDCDDPDEISKCNLTRLIDEQTADVMEALKWIKAQPGVDPNKVAVSGNSYGGIVSVLTNGKAWVPFGTQPVQKAVVAFSPGGLSWGNNPFLKDRLVEAAGYAARPAYYLQAKWDNDTRPAVELAYAHAMGGSDDKHGKEFNAGIFAFEDPPDDACDPGQPDYHKIHGSFAAHPEYWGGAVSDFLERWGVK